MHKVFVSYRRHLDADAAGRIHDRMVPAFGRENIFFDVAHASSLAGIDFARELDRQVALCTDFLAIIGHGWVENLDRLHSEDDFVRIETASALRRDGIRVIPVLVGGAQMPDANLLPEDLRGLHARGWIEAGGAFFDAGVESLIAAIRAPVPDDSRNDGDPPKPPVPPPRTRRRWPLAVAALAVLATVATLFWKEMLDVRCKMADQPWEISYCD